MFNKAEARALAMLMKKEIDIDLFVARVSLAFAVGAAKISHKEANELVEGYFRLKTEATAAVYNQLADQLNKEV